MRGDIDYWNDKLGKQRKEWERDSDAGGREGEGSVIHCSRILCVMEMLTSALSDPVAITTCD